ncbi:REP-associated tyrosine transposase [Pseudoxanthomonas sp. 22568]|uniref:REP-associated tyrosine transposase n=1 Tax=Pseudoxanthomonas sp. 22568 TaxID=3453945 RepID=UPI003F856BA4
MSPAACRLRHGRASVPSSYYLLTICCHRRQPWLRKSEAAKLVIDAARWLETRNRIELGAIMVMPDHVHMVVQLRTGTLAGLMHGYKGYTAHALNRVLSRQGRLWQAGYHDSALQTEEALHQAISYCLQNPMRARLVEDFRDYPHWWCRWPV